MPPRDNSKIECFKMWKEGRTVEYMQKELTALPSVVKGWVREWDRGKSGRWETAEQSNANSN